MKYRSYSYEEYYEAMELLEKGLGPTEVSRILGISKRTVKAWKYEGKIPWLAKWHPTPSKELSYILGVLHGDGYIVKPRKNVYDIELMVKDYKFAETFSKALSKLLNKRFKKPCWSENHSRWRIFYYSKAFHRWYRKQTLETLKSYIEYNKDTVKLFLRGIYDSEGYNYKCKQIFLANSNPEILNYIQYLLKKYFNIKTTGPYLIKKAGSINRKRNGERIKTRHNTYSIAISRKRDVQIFLSEIGFSITEKRLGLKRRR